MKWNKTKTCIRCPRLFDPRTGAFGLCPACYTKEKRNERKAELVQMLGGACSDCGYDKCIHALHFHHTEDNKESGISRMLKRNMAWEKILKEVKKCILLCANCHAEHHWGEAT